MFSGGKLLAAIAALCVLAATFYLNSGSKTSLPDVTQVAQQSTETAQKENRSPFSEDADSEQPGPVENDAIVVSGVGSDTRVTGLDRRAANNSLDSEPDLPPIDLQSIAWSNLDRTDQAALVQRLQADPELLNLLIDEFRTEKDPDRLRRLSQLLGDVDQPSVLDAATEFIYSGDPALAAVGHDLLRRVQPGNSQAQAVVSGLLSSETEPAALIGALSVIGRPDRNATDTHSEIAEQVALLTSHEDVAVRRNSMTVLSRWSSKPEHTALLLDGLSDADESVRQTAAYAFVDHKGASEVVMQGLFAFVENSNESERGRRGAILSLKSMPLDAERQRRLLDIEKQLDRRPARNQ